MYIPESYIIETGYSQGDDFLISDSSQPYKGFYHKDKQNRYWSGEKHTDRSFLLTRVTANSDLTLDNVVKNNYISGGFARRFSDDLNVPLFKGTTRIPIEEDYIKGYYTRYFIQLKASINLYIVEISKEDYDNITNNRTYLNYYIVAPVIWKLTGPVHDVHKNNIRLISGIEDTNLRSIQEGKKIIKNIDLYLTDPLQYVRVTK